MKGQQIYTIVWQGIEIKITHRPNFIVSRDHLGIQANQPLPFTSTGYRSLFQTETELRAAGGVVELVQSWLSEAAQSQDWKDYWNSKQQLSLF